ncbi:MAG: PHB depolymerase family esterase [Croceibacterium sp.]
MSSLPLGGPFRASGSTARLTRLAEFGTNPGALDAWTFVPTSEPTERLPLVVVLHGCTQTADGYDSGSGWSQLGEAFGFAALFPEQRRANNPNMCFNWFEPGDTRRGAGEALSIAQMIGTMIEHHGVDRDRVYITGLSAGGAMTSVMLASYPELFAGGAILAGLPHGAAASMQEAFQQMRSPSRGKPIKSTSPHDGPWPTVSIWHGTADTVVNPSNADAIVEQWKEVHGLAGTVAEDQRVDGYPHRAWRDAGGTLRVEEYEVTGMGHGTPLDTSGECACGKAGAFMLEVGISSTVHSARTWGLLGQRRTPDRNELAPDPVSQSSPALGRTAPLPRAAEASPTPANDAITKVIEDALRAAGLMK